MTAEARTDNLLSRFESHGKLIMSVEMLIAEGEHRVRYRHDEVESGMTYISGHDRSQLLLLPEGG
jgi:hypothetical protein